MMKQMVTSVAMGLFLLAGASAARADDPDEATQARPPVVAAVLACRALTDPTARLACFDREAGTLDTALTNGDVVAADRTEVRRANRSLFGLSLPRIRIFGSHDDEVTTIEGDVQSIARGGDGRAVFTLTDGARWMQTDDHTLVGVRAGTHVTIRRGALGSFFAAFRGSSSVRVRRVN